MPGHSVIWVDAPEGTCLQRLKARLRATAGAPHTDVALERAAQARIAAAKPLKTVLSKAYHYRNEDHPHGIMHDVANVGAAVEDWPLMRELEERVQSILTRPIPGYAVPRKV
jgi:hypothetical protein